MDINEVKHTRLLTYNISVPRKVSNNTKDCGFSDTECLNVVISNLIACIRKNNVLVYSRMLGEKVVKNKYNKKGITPYRIKKVVEFLESQEMVVNYTGKSSADPLYRRVSFLVPTNKFIGQWIEECKKMEEVYLDKCRVIHVRGEDKIDIDYIEDETMTQMENLVRSVNKMNEGHEIRDKDNNILTNIYCRIFNGDTEHGGRWYRADVLSITNRVSHERLDITIDGQPVCEVDYSNLHFRIVSAMEGIPLWSIPDDLYSSILDDPTNKTDRKIIKFAVNIMFNCESEEQARMAIQSAINKLSEEEKKEYTCGKASLVILQIYEAYPDFKYIFFEDSLLGLKLQNADSCLAADILQEMLKRNIPCLPVHDSFIVPLDKMDFLAETMADKFRERFNVDGVVPMKMKWKEKGIYNEYMVVK